MIIQLPWPDPALNPNRKNGKHWGTTNAVKDKRVRYWQRLKMLPVNIGA